jgi:hypothetical protein
MIHRYGRCWTLRLCMSCGRLIWPGQKALFTQCGPRTEHAYHRGRCAVQDRPIELMWREREWCNEVRRRREGRCRSTR